MDFQTRYQFNPRIDLLGKGGFSKVYKAKDVLLDRTVALKLFISSASEKYQVLSEIKKVIQFEHPNLCKYYDVAIINSTNVFGETEKTEVGIMEYLDSGDLKTYLNNNPQFADKLLIDVLKGLSYLHKKGIVHRDLKPQNILVKMEDGEPIAKITDFGISKLISSEDNNSSALIGTIEYMAPEQFNPKKYGIAGRITTNLDLWSFGLLVYEVVHHRSLFGRRSDGSSAEQVMRNILSDTWSTKLDHLPSKYRAIVKKCLVKNASDRVQNASELIPLFNEDLIEAEKVIVDKSKAQEDHISINDPEIQQPEEEDYDGDTRVVEQIDTSTVAYLPDQPSEEHTSTKHIPVEQPWEKELNIDDTQVIEPDRRQDFENTEVHHLEQEASRENIELIQLDQENVENTETQVIQPEQGMTGEMTEVYQPEQEVPVHGSTPHNSFSEHQSAPILATSTDEVQLPNIPQQEKAVPSKKKSVPKRLLFIIAGVLVVTPLFLLKFFSEDKPKVVKNKVQQNNSTAPAQQPFPLPKLIKVEGGSFLMGFEDKEATESELPAHLVKLTTFSIGMYEVTIDQFRQFVTDSKYITTAEEEGTSDIYKNGEWQTIKSINWRHDISGNLLDTSIKNIPVIHVSWTDANKYCEWLSNKHNMRFRLPSEAEWEFAARGGNISGNFLYSGSNNLEQVAWYSKNSEEKIHSVGQKRPNELRIHDMSGNVLEWCNDWYDENYYKHSETDNPGGPTSGKARVVRGGSWFLVEKTWFRNSYRAGFSPNVRGAQLGFRICISEVSQINVSATGK